jgi:tetratricopeptide (TPR) repeat protein/nucleoside phosphorylase
VVLLLSTADELPFFLPLFAPSYKDLLEITLLALCFPLEIHYTAEVDREWMLWRNRSESNMVQEVPALSTCEIVILTALPVEFQAVMAYLQETQEIVHPRGTIYRVGSFVGAHGPLRVAVAQIGMGGKSAAIETERAIHFFRPNLSLFVGIAGGLKDVQLGDVVAATKVYAYESGKAGRTFEPRPEVWRASYPLEQRARQEVSDEAWQTRLKSVLPDSVPRAHIGALAAGEKVLASTQSAVYAHIKATYGDALAIEMEGHGFLEAIHVNHDMHGLVIRGISDLIDDKVSADAGGSQIRAAHHAAAFAFQVLTTFTVSPSGGTLSPLTHRAIWNVPLLRNLHFTGRDELLDQLEEHLAPAAHDEQRTPQRVALTQPQAITGLGGIGKTQLAAEYAYRSRERGRYTHTLWINAASEETIIASFVELAADVLPASVVQSETDQDKLAAAVRRWLERCEQSWLLIFDNADDLSIIRSYLPRSGNGGVLLTTRAHAVGSLATSVEVEVMGLLEGTHLLLRRAQRFEHASDEEINQAGDIVVALDHFPLALDQAGAYLEETQCSFEDYLDLYRTYRQELLAQRGKEATNYPDSVATTWSLSFRRVERANPAAAELLELCSFLAPDRIPEELLRDGAVYWPAPLQQATADPLQFQQLIAELLKFSLMKRLVEEHALSIHRLVQAVQRDQMETESQRQWAERVIQAMNVVFPENPGDQAVWPQCLRYLDQVQACYGLIEHYKLALVEAASVFSRTSHYLDDHALYAIAEPLLLCALEIREQRLGAIHPDTAESLNNLALLYRAQGRYSEAEPLYQRAIQICEQQFGTTHPQTVTSLNNLAALYHAQGRYSEAESLYQHALQICEQQFGAIHPVTAQGLNNLAHLYIEQGRYRKAEPLYQQVLAICEQHLGAAHTLTATVLNNLAALYDAQRRYRKAEPLYQRALRIREQQLGPEHPDTAISLNNLAFLYQAQRKYSEAEPLYQRALRIREQRLGAIHPDTAESLNNLALLYRAQGRYSEAESLLQRALEIREQQLGATHPKTAESLNNLAFLYQIQRRYSEAESLYQRALQICGQQLGRNHPVTQTVSKNYLALILKMELEKKRRWMFGLFPR